jgi:hypothetical protein
MDIFTPPWPPPALSVTARRMQTLALSGGCNTNISTRVSIVLIVVALLSIRPLQLNTTYARKILCKFSSRRLAAPEVGPLFYLCA